MSFGAFFVLEAEAVQLVGEDYPSTAIAVPLPSQGEARNVRSRKVGRKCGRYKPRDHRKRCVDALVAWREQPLYGFVRRR